ncbi:DUF7427 family protein [Mycolicibacterium gilvum]|uniref:DUF7427 family protein n=1 Tax=Mycolicibacterium gilvum TaxID=1804 RepID=UPI00404577C9
MRPANRAWLVLAAGVIGYEIAAAPGELLSEAADDWMLSHPWLTRAVAFSLASHICNAIPDTCDPIHHLFVLKQRLR